VQVHCDEGIANRIDPEPCAGIREDVGEASAGERTGQPLSRDRIFVPGADTVTSVEGNTDGRVNASVRWARRGRRTWHVRTLFAREPGDLGSDQPPYGLARSGKARSRSR
jgi:hypothetical protein